MPHSATGFRPNLSTTRARANTAPNTTCDAEITAANAIAVVRFHPKSPASTSGKKYTTALIPQNCCAAFAATATPVAARVSEVANKSR